MAKKKTATKSKTKSASKPKSRSQRASWKGNVSFGLVSFAVEAFNALDRSGSDIHFHQLHAECHSRIHYDKVCPIHGKISNDEIVSGYEYSKGKYIEIDPDELDELRSESDRALKIDAFIAPDVIDPLYFDGRMYYLMPAEMSAQEPYAVIANAMNQEDRYAVGQVVFSGKDQPVLIRPVEGVLHMAMLNYSAEIRPPEKIAESLKKRTSSSRETKLAQTLIRDWSDDDFDFTTYKDDYREQVEHLIEAKVKGKKVVAPKEEKEEPVTISLMDALKKSLGKSRAAKSGTTKSHKRHTA